VLIVSFALTFILIVFAFPALPINGELLDLKPGYTFQEVVAEMEIYGESGRAVYAWASPTLDTFFPIVYVTFFAGLIYRCRPTESLWWLALLPIVAGLWDLAENAQITTMLLQYPDISSTQVDTASFFTIVKGYMGMIYQSLGVLLLLVSLIRAGIGKFRSS